MRRIDADRLKAEIFKACMDSHFMPTKLLDCDDVTELIDNAPTIEERPKGKWIKNAPPWDCQNPPFICSECGNPHLLFETPYCEICGADMRGDV